MWKKGKKKKGSITEHEDYVKAAAWAWYLHGAGAQSKHNEEHNMEPREKSLNEIRPTRFKLESMGLLNNSSWMKNNFAILDTFESDSDSVTGCTSFRDLSSVECETKICGSSLFDYYELAALLKQLELLYWGAASPAYGKELPTSTKSWMDNGICPDLCNKKPNAKLPRNSSQVLIPGYFSGRESLGSKKKHSHWRLYDLARKLQAFGIGVSSSHM
ncbi:hypothetical protein SUGI_0810610 [Cryptomeria japonica]|uniref:uncharacterized protein LOC131044813 n=1 Tax=Cryptomeria japonica TaxID=3369 RepID=UPI002414C1ED|nr:uncharacterized protein LOC131044813 [Cryptomeria japonica]GLJ39651.1 hypothetical protein SUGI_0810610 [Cryptomeria japonica]